MESIQAGLLRPTNMPTAETRQIKAQRPGAQLASRNSKPGVANRAFARNFIKRRQRSRKRVHRSFKRRSDAADPRRVRGRASFRNYGGSGGAATRHARPSALEAARRDEGPRRAAAASRVHRRRRCRHVRRARPWWRARGPGRAGTPAGRAELQVITRRRCSRACPDGRKAHGYSRRIAWARLSLSRRSDRRAVAAIADDSRRLYGGSSPRSGAPAPRGRAAGQFRQIIAGWGRWTWPSSAGGVRASREQVGDGLDRGPGAWRFGRRRAAIHGAIGDQLTTNSSIMGLHRARTRPRSSSCSAGQHPPCGLRLRASSTRRPASPIPGGAETQAVRRCIRGRVRKNGHASRRARSSRRDRKRVGDRGPRPPSSRHNVGGSRRRGLRSMRCHWRTRQVGASGPAPADTSSTATHPGPGLHPHPRRG